MGSYRPAEIGMTLADVDTPALLLDLDALQSTAVEAVASERLLNATKRQPDGPLGIAVVHIVFCGSQVRIAGARPHVSGIRGAGARERAAGPGRLRTGRKGQGS